MIQCVDKAIEILHNSVPHEPVADEEPHDLDAGISSDHANVLSYLGVSYTARYYYHPLQRKEDIMQAIELLLKSISAKANCQHLTSTLPLTRLQLGRAYLLGHLHLSDNPARDVWLQSAVKLTLEARLSVGIAEARSAYMYFHDHGLALFHHFLRFGDPHELKQAIANLDAAVNLHGGGADTCALLDHLAAALELRFRNSGDITDIDTAIELCMRSLAHADHGRNSWSGPLSFFWRWTRRACLADLGFYLATRYRHNGMPEDIERALQYLNNAKPLDVGSVRVRCLDNLGLAHMYRYQKRGSLDDLNKAISVCMEGIEHAERHNVPSGIVANVRSNVTVYLEMRYSHHALAGDLEESIKQGELALDCTPEDHAYYGVRLGNLGIARLAKFSRYGRLTDIDRAISDLQRAVDIITPNHAYYPSFGNGLAVALFRRFKRLDERADIDAAISMHRSITTLAAADHPDRCSYFNDFGNSLLQRFERFGDMADINEAILTHRTVLASAVEGDANLPAYMNNLSLSLMQRFDCSSVDPPENASERHAMEHDIAEATELLEHGLSLVHRETHSLHHMISDNLGCAFLRRGRYSGAREHFDRAIQILNEATNVLHGQDRSLKDATTLYNLAHARYERWYIFKTTEDQEFLVDNLRSACDSPYASPYVRFIAAKLWADVLHQWGVSPQYPLRPAHDLRSALEAYSRCIDLLPQIAWIGLSMEMRLTQLSTLAQSVASDAFACATSLSELEPSASRQMLEKAVEMLDRGRSVVWAQAIQFREDITSLWERDPALADRLETLSNHLSPSSIGLKTLAEEQEVRVHVFQDDWSDFNTM